MRWRGTLRRHAGRLPAALAALAGLAAVGAASPRPAAAQDANVRWSVEEAERRLALEPFEVAFVRDTRFPGDRTQHAMLRFADGERVLVKLAAAPRGGGTFNNRPRYEVAAYRLQKLFLEEEGYVVPPTVVRSFPLEWYRTVDADVEPTFGESDDVIVVVQYWLWSVTDEDVWDEARLATDSVYARHIANLNVFTYLARHRDSNQGNIVLSTAEGSPRVFSVDNGLTFGHDRSARGTFWSKLRVERLPGRTVARLRALTLERLRQELGVLAQFELRGDHLERVEPGANLDPGDGVRYEDGVLQLGLTDGEIEGVWDRIEDLVEKVDEGEITTY